MLLHDLLSDAAARWPERVAVVCGGERLTFAELDQRSNSMARALCDRGVTRGDRVLVFADNSVETVVSVWATLKANAVFSMISPTTRQDRLSWYLENSRAAALVSQASLERVFGAVVGTRVLIVGERFERSEEAPVRRSIDVDLAAILYTSGSTGSPKGVMLTHRNMLAATESISAYLGYREDDVVMCALPLSFDYGLYQVFLSAKAGACLVLERSFALPAPVLRRMTEERVTVFPGMPTFFALLAGMPSRSGMPSVRLVSSTGAALLPKHIELVDRLFPSARLFSMYGLTECKRCTYVPPDVLRRKPGSIGIAIPNTELWLVDENDRRLGPHQLGQLVIRGATVMRGYWEDPEGTAERLKPGPLPGEQVLYTGDLCRLDDEGYLTFVRRMDDVIKSRGEKVAPREVEAALTSIPGVREAAVIGVVDEVLGHAIKAFITLEPGMTFREADLRAACGLTLEAHLVPKHIELLDRMPLTSNGKIDKQALQAR